MMYSLNSKTKGAFTFCRVLERLSNIVIVAKNLNKRLFLQKDAWRSQAWQFS